MQRKIKISIIVAVFGIAVIGIGLLVYFTMFTKNGYHLTSVEHTDYTAADFKDSALQLYNNGTFHVHITHGEKGLFFLGLGTYTQEGDTYYFTFQQAVGRQNDIITDQMAQFTDVLVCKKHGNRIKFVDHNHQVYYFG